MAKTKKEKEIACYEVILELIREKLVNMGVILISMAIGDTMTQPLRGGGKREIVNLIIKRVRGKGEVARKL